MAVSGPTDLGVFQATVNGLNGSVTCAAACPAGTLVIVYITGISASLTYSVTDSKLNTWVVGTTSGQSTSPASNACMAYSFITNALTTSDTITVSHGTSTGMAFYAEAWSGLDPAGTVTAFTASSGNPGTNPGTIALTSATVNAGQLSAGVFSFAGGATSFVANSPYTLGHWYSSGFTRSVAGVWQVHASTSSTGPAGTEGGSNRAWAGAGNQFTPITSTNGSVPAAAATATCAASAPTVTGSQNPTSAPPAATGAGQALTPAVSGTRNPTSSAPSATVTASAPTPGVAAGTTVSAPTGTAAGQARTPTVSGGANVAAAAASGSGHAAAPAVSAGTGTAPPTAAATFAAPPPAVTAVRNATVTPPAGTVAGQAKTPAVTGVTTVLAVVAAVNAQAKNPVATGTTSGSVVAATAQASVLALAAVVSIAADITPPAGLVTAGVSTPAVSAFSPRDITVHPGPVVVLWQAHTSRTLWQPGDSQALWEGGPTVEDA